MPFLLKSELFLKGTDMATGSYNIYCKIRDWKENITLRFVDIMKKGEKND